MGSCLTKKTEKPLSTSKITPTTGLKTTPGSSTMIDARPNPIQIEGQLGSFVLADSEKYTDVLNYYLLKNTVGHGQFGSVKLAIHRTGSKKRKFAVKIIPKERVKACFQQLQRELLYLKMSDHPNVIRLYEVFEDKRNVNIVMEYLSGGELYDRLEKKKRFPEREAAALMYKLFHAVSHLHFRGICHRDLKPENFLYDSKREDAEIKIIDFGLGNKFDSVNKEMHTVVGTPYYVAPEVLRKNYGKECDIWSLGVIMYAVLVGFPPFNGSSDQEIQRKILKGDYHFRHTEWESISREAKELIKNLLSQDPAKRLQANEVLNHPWFLSFNDLIKLPINPTIVTRLREFRSGGPLRREALKTISQFIPNEAIRELTVAFRVLDEEHIGYLSQEGMVRKTVNEEGGLSAEEVRVLFNEVELYQGRMPFTEFIVVGMDREVYTQAEPLMAAFKYFDSSDKGEVMVDDVRKVFTKSGKTVMDDEITRLISEFDGNKDGKMNYDEFCSMVSLLPTKVHVQTRPTGRQ